MGSGLPQLILASASPRRRELLAALGLPFQLLATDAEDQAVFPPVALAQRFPPVALPPEQHPTLLAWRKAAAACRECPDDVIIGADTMVVLDAVVLGKPANTAHAQATLRRLAGRSHVVYTGLALLAPHGAWFACVASQVTMHDLSDAQIADYVATGEPMDKAGAYGIQGLGGQLVAAVSGSYTNVVGLPLVAASRLLADAGRVCPVPPGEAYRRWLFAQGKEPLPCPPTFP